MSSHHIVRDEQEPAIVITDMKKQYWLTIEQLLGWVPTVIVNEECVNEVLLTGIKIDIVICQEQTLPSQRELLKDQQPIKFIVNKEESIISTAISHLVEKGYKGVNIFGGFDIKKSLLINKYITTIWYDEKYRYILSSQHTFQKWMIKNHSFRLLPVKEYQDFELINAKKVEQEIAYFCSQDGKVVIDSKADFWIGEQL